MSTFAGEWDVAYPAFVEELERVGRNRADVSVIAAVESFSHPPYAEPEPDLLTDLGAVAARWHERGADELDRPLGHAGIARGLLAAGGARRPGRVAPRSSQAVRSRPRGTLRTGMNSAPNEPSLPEYDVPPSHCIRCGKPTPPGVSLCEVDNPGHIKAPSALQVHGTMLLGVGIGVAGFLLLAQLTICHAGPFAASLAAAPTQADGSVQVQLLIENQGSSDSIANCRVTRDGSARSDDLALRTPMVPANRSITITRTLPVPAQPPPYDPARLTIACG